MTAPNPQLLAQRVASRAAAATVAPAGAATPNAASQSISTTGAGALVKSLEALGVEVIFGIPGGAILPAYDPLYDSSVRHILVRHEQGAGHAATGYAQVRQGVRASRPPAGRDQLVTPIADAHM